MNRKDSARMHGHEPMISSGCMCATCTAARNAIRDVPSAMLTDLLSQSDRHDMLPPHLRAEKLSGLRGHAFLPDDINEWPHMGDTDDLNLMDKPVAARYFTSDAEWLVIELDRRTGEAYGYVTDKGASYEANFMLPDLEQQRYFDFTRSDGFPAIVERDTNFRPGITVRLATEGQSVNR